MNQLRMEYSFFRSINVDFPPPPVLQRSYNEEDFEDEKSFKHVSLSKDNWSKDNLEFPINVVNKKGWVAPF